ncbi:Putative uncharacterized protein [Lactobacillus delbrueckii subsp. lactis]|nr:Putative uncharacterized protein [Lactobacillus delbrueckii subsp. lactis]
MFFKNWRTFFSCTNLPFLSVRKNSLKLNEYLPKPSPVKLMSLKWSLISKVYMETFGRLLYGLTSFGCSSDQASLASCSMV